DLRPVRAGRHAERSERRRAAADDPVAIGLRLAQRRGPGRARRHGRRPCARGRRRPLGARRLRRRSQLHRRARLLLPEVLMRRSAILAAVAAATLLVSLAGAAQAAPAQAPAVDVTSRHAADARQAETSKRLSALAEAVVDAGAPGAIVARRTSAKDVVAVAEGRADTRTGRAAHPADRHRIGSMTKTMVAVVVLQLVEEGRLGLDDSVAELLPEFELDPRITVRHLLLQTSG